MTRLHWFQVTMLSLIHICGDILTVRKEAVSLNLSYIRYFVTLAHVRHYTKAAEQLCITPVSYTHLQHGVRKMGFALGKRQWRKKATR